MYKHVLFNLYISNLMMKFFSDTFIPNYLNLTIHPFSSKKNLSSPLSVAKNKKKKMIWNQNKLSEVEKYAYRIELKKIFHANFRLCILLGKKKYNMECYIVHNAATFFWNFNL
ncbi:hypothetical protein BpHYR1_029994 [Brachionus plicatilis]|uniref:Uncharacterized protein n=1 Tax=Brachionus plicatilis TaxID=10195 RepID=A0A3M7QU89_BRAPC|nr:hypothetical protein BpHYR1_029994 [Brachionus plicatilis]